MSVSPGRVRVMAALLARKTGSRAKRTEPGEQRTRVGVERPKIAQGPEQQRVGSEKVELAQVAEGPPARPIGVLAENIGVDDGFLVGGGGCVGRHGVE